MTTVNLKAGHVDAEPVRQHIRGLMASGASITRITKASGGGASRVTYILYGGGPERPPAQQVRAETAALLLAVRPQHITPGRIDATGTSRRIKALMAIGWPQLALAPHIGLHLHYVTQILRTSTVYSATAHSVSLAYDQLWNSNPRHHGVSQQAVTRVTNYARANHWAPPAAWDDAVIDDPDAHPDWTGHCGTDRGWWTHRAARQTPCPRCVEAHNQWRAANAALTPAERARLMGKARAEASGREAAIAEDARELFAQGYDRHQIADRLGVTLSHLDHSITRHAQRQDDEQAAA